MCLRVGLFAENGKKQSSAKHIYLKGAQVLRPDIAVIDAVAIDGPAGSGKSTVAKAIAKALGYVYVDTGAMYRTIGLDCSENGIDCRDEKAVSQKAESTDIELKFENGLQKIYLNKKDVTEKIRTQECAENASLVARYPYVREKLASLQRKIAEDTQVVMDGRDIGTNILPGAKTKIYLDASSEVRAKRRVGELKDKGIEADFSQILARVIQRDEQDKNREHNPLTVAKDAHVIDTSNMSVDEVREKILAIVRGE
ncbi:MAG: (d)CMP kinase [Firmicutes bacterium]|nr:(d)CMP kinase [Bacillota bacterium]